MRIKSVPVKHNPLVAKIALYLLALFNLAVISSIAIAVVALFVLFGLISPVLPYNTVWYVWALPTTLVALQTAVILERRINFPAPNLNRPMLAIVGAITHQFPPSALVRRLFVKHVVSLEFVDRHSPVFCLKYDVIDHFESSDEFRPRARRQDRLRRVGDHHHERAAGRGDFAQAPRMLRPQRIKAPGPDG